MGAQSSDAADDKRSTARKTSAKASRAARNNGKSISARAGSAKTAPASFLDPSRWVTADVHKTPTSIMKLPIPKRIKALIKLHGSPLMVISKDQLVAEYKRFARLLPRVRLFYAIKANPHPDIIRTLADLGGCFDCASENEIRHVLNNGASADRVIFANTVKRPDALEYAKKAKVNLVTFDNEPELYKIAKHHPGCGVMCRLKVANLGSIVELSLKFGADEDQVVPMLLKARSLGLKPKGVSFHVGSQCTNVENYLQAFEQVSDIIEDAAKHGLKISMVNIGGGFPIRHFKDDTTSLETIAPTLRREMDRMFDKDIDIIAEPGRALAGPAGMLITRVIGRSIRNNKNYYYLDDGVYGDFSGTVFDHCKYEFRTLVKTQKFLSILAGPTCDSFDTISLGQELPELDVNSVIYVPNIGAYSCASALVFNGIPPAKVIVV